MSAHAVSRAAAATAAQLFSDVQADWILCIFDLLFLVTISQVFLWLLRLPWLFCLSLVELAFLGPVDQGFANVILGFAWCMNCELLSFFAFKLPCNDTQFQRILLVLLRLLKLSLGGLLRALPFRRSRFEWPQ